MKDSKKESSDDSSDTSSNSSDSTETDSSNGDETEALKKESSSETSDTDSEEEDDKKSRRSRSKINNRSRSKSRVKSPKSRSKPSRSRSKSRGRLKKRSRSWSRKWSESRSRSRRRSVNRSRSRKRSISWNRHRKRSRSLSRGRKWSRSPSKIRRRSRTRSINRKWSRSPSRGRKRSRSWSRSRSISRRRSRSKSRGRNRSRSRSRRKRSHSHSKYRRRRSRSKSYKSPYSRKSRSRSRSHTRSKTSRTSKRSPSVSKEKRTPDTLDSLRDKTARKRLLEVARKNAVYLMKNNCLPPSIEKESVQATGKSVQELTSFCKQLVAKQFSDDELSNASLSAEEPDSPSVTFSEGRHPFSVKDNKPIMMNIRNAPMMTPKTNAERLADASKLREQFPVSSGSDHRNVAENQWVPVEKSESEKDSGTVFPDAIKNNVDISRLVSTRMDAMRKLQSNPKDKEAMKTLKAAQKQMASWALSKQVPGQFTGSTGAKILSQEELASGYQPWVKKEQFRKANPVRSQFGMKMLTKMGWSPGQGLGKNKEGQTEPLLIDFKIDKKGLTSQTEMNSGRAMVPLNKCLGGKHPVTALAEICTKNKWSIPVYETVYDYGPVHKKNFLVQVQINGQIYKPSSFTSSKKVAKANAAAAALQALGFLKDPNTAGSKGTLSTAGQDENQTQGEVKSDTQARSQDQPKAPVPSQVKAPLLPPPAPSRTLLKSTLGTSHSQESSQNNFHSSTSQYPNSSSQSSNASQYAYGSPEAYHNNNQSQTYQSVSQTSGYQNSGGQAESYQAGAGGYHDNSEAHVYQDRSQPSLPQYSSTTTTTTQDAYQPELQASSYASSYPEGYSDQSAVTQYSAAPQEDYHTYHAAALQQYSTDTQAGYPSMLVSYSQAEYSTPQTSVTDSRTSTSGGRKSEHGKSKLSSHRDTEALPSADHTTYSTYSVDPQAGYAQMTTSYGTTAAAAAAAADPYATSAAYYEQLQQYYGAAYQGQQY